MIADYDLFTFHFYYFFILEETAAAHNPLLK